jgi:hypothetical protein
MVRSDYLIHRFSCSHLEGAARRKSELPNGGIESVRGKPYMLQLASGSIALNATHLPVGRNMNYPNRAKEISQDFEVFLGRHNRHGSG